MKRSICAALGAAIVAAAMAATLAGCGQAAKQEEAPAEEAPAATAESSSPEAVPAEAGEAPEAPEETSAAPEEPAATEAAPKINLGELNLLSVHESDGAVVADAVLEVINTSDVPVILNAGELGIYGPEGTEIMHLAGNGVFTGPSYLRPGDVGFIYTSGPVALPEGYAADQEYGLTGDAVLATCKEVWEYPVSDLALTDDGYGVPMVTGTVTNDDDGLADLIEITAVFLDNERNMLGVASTVVVNLEPGTSTDFTIDGYTLPVGCTMAVIADYDVIAVAPKF